MLRKHYYFYLVVFSSKNRGNFRPQNRNFLNGCPSIKKFGFILKKNSKNDKYFSRSQWQARGARLYRAPERNRLKDAPPEVRGGGRRDLKLIILIEKCLFRFKDVCYVFICIIKYTIMVCRIAILGDFNVNNTLHHAVNDSIRHSQNQLDAELQCDWIQTDLFDPQVVFNDLYSGLWIVPGSPYRSMEGVLNAVQYARAHNIPTLGTCAGFQHMLIEVARNLCGLDKADHEETSTENTDFVISKLTCSLVGQEEDLKVIDKDSKISELLPKGHFKGKYHCNYGLNKDFVEKLKEQGCRMTVASSEGEIRAFELDSHPFFLGTLFQTPLASNYENPNPIILEFLKQCIRFSESKTI